MVYKVEAEKPILSYNIISINPPDLFQIIIINVVVVEFHLLARVLFDLNKSVFFSPFLSHNFLAEHSLPIILIVYPLLTFRAVVARAKKQ